MSLIVLEAVGALALFVFLIWWTMFAGRRHGELHGELHAEQQDKADGAGTPQAAHTTDRDALPPSDHPAERGGSRNEPG